MDIKKHIFYAIILTAFITPIQAMRKKEILQKKISTAGKKKKQSELDKRIESIELPSRKSNVIRNKQRKLQQDQNALKNVVQDLGECKDLLERLRRRLAHDRLKKVPVKQKDTITNNPEPILPNPNNNPQNDTDNSDDNRSWQNRWNTILPIAFISTATIMALTYIIYNKTNQGPVIGKIADKTDAIFL